MTPAKDPEALRRELVGWYLYDFANSAFFQSAMTVRARSTRLGPSAICRRRSRPSKCHFARFLVFSARDTHAPFPVATERAGVRAAVGGRPREYVRVVAPQHGPARILRLVRGRRGPDQLRAVRGRRRRADPLGRPGLRSGDVRGPALAGAPRRYQPDVLHLHDDLHLRAVPGDRVHHRRQPRGLRELPPARARRIGCARRVRVLRVHRVAVQRVAVLARGLLIMLSNISLGVSVVFYNSYLPLMVEDSALVQGAVEGKAKGALGDDDVYKAREAANSEYSSKGQMWGYVGGTTCLVLSVVVVAVCSMVLSASDWWSYGIAASLSGIWWLAFFAGEARGCPGGQGRRRRKTSTCSCRAGSAPAVCCGTCTRSRRTRTCSCFCSSCSATGTPPSPQCPCCSPAASCAWARLS